MALTARLSWARACSPRRRPTAKTRLATIWKWRACSWRAARGLTRSLWALDDAVARAPELADDEHYVAARRLVEGVVAAGSYKKYVRLPLQELLNLLSLAQRGKLATTDPVMKSLVGVDNHVVWNVLTYWAES